MLDPLAKRIALPPPARGREQSESSGSSKSTDQAPRTVDKAAALTCRLAWNHPLPDGNKRAAWASLVMFRDLNGIAWLPGQPDVDEAEAAMLTVAAHDVDEDWLAAWLRQRTRPG